MAKKESCSKCEKMGVGGVLAQEHPMSWFQLRWDFEHPETSKQIRSRSVSIEGNIGVGKSTAIELAKSAHDSKRFNFPPIHKFLKEPIELYTNWEDLFNPLKEMYENKSNIAISQLHIMRESQRYFSSGLERCSSNIVTERCYLSTLAFLETYYKVGVFSKFVYTFLKEEWLQLVSKALIPDGIVFLDSTPELCYERIKKRKRDGEENVTLEFLQILDEEIKKSCLIFEKTLGCKIIRVPVNESTTKTQLEKDIITAIQCSFTNVFMRDTNDIIAESHNLPAGFQFLDQDKSHQVNIEMYPYCKWCGDVLGLNEKHCCEKCLEVCAKQCQRCHKAYPHLKYFSDPSDNYCISCKTCMSRQQLQKQDRKKNEKDIFHVLSKESQKGSVIKNKRVRKQKTRKFQNNDFILKTVDKGLKKCKI